MLVKGGSSDGSIFGANLEQFSEFLEVPDNLKFLVLDEGSLSRRFDELKFGFGFLFEQVIYLLVIYFDVTAPEQVLFFSFSCSYRHDLSESSRNDSLAFLRIAP